MSLVVVKLEKLFRKHTINVRVQRRQQGGSLTRRPGCPRVFCCFVFHSDEDGISAVTTWIVGDFEKESGRKLLLNALNHMVGELFISSFF